MTRSRNPIYSGGIQAANGSVRQTTGLQDAESQAEKVCRISIQLTVAIRIFPDLENPIGVTCKTSQVDHVFKAVFAGFYVACSGAGNRAPAVRDVKNVTVLRCEFDQIPTGANIPRQPASKIIDIDFDEIQDPADTAVRSGALVLAEFSLSCFVHIDGIPVVSCCSASDDAGGTGVLEQLTCIDLSIGIAVGLHLKDQDGIGRDCIGKTSGWRCQPPGKAEFQPLFGDGRVRTVGPADFDAQISIEEIPWLRGGDIPYGIWRGGRGKKRRIYRNESGFGRRRKQWNAAPVRFATRTYERCNDAFLTCNCCFHAFSEISVAGPQYGHAIGVIRGCTAGLDVCKTNVLSIARTAGEFGRIIAEQNANLGLIVKTRHSQG